jgi:hypothetical protein
MRNDLGFGDRCARLNGAWHGSGHCMRSSGKTRRADRKKPVNDLRGNEAQMDANLIEISLTASTGGRRSGGHKGPNPVAIPPRPRKKIDVHLARTESIETWERQSPDWRSRAHLPQLISETGVEPNTSRLHGLAFLRQAGPKREGVNRPGSPPFYLDNPTVEINFQSIPITGKAWITSGPRRFRSASRQIPRIARFRNSECNRPIRRRITY